MPDIDDVSEAVIQSAIDPASASADGQSTTGQDPLKLIAVKKHLADEAAVEGTNPNGGPRGAWVRARRERFVTNGTAPQ